MKKESRTCPYGRELLIEKVNNVFSYMIILLFHQLI